MPEPTFALTGGQPAGEERSDSAFKLLPDCNISVGINLTLPQPTR